jgi:hypothetical protein
MQSILPALAFAAVITAQFASVIAARAVTQGGLADRSSAQAMRAARANAE